MTGPSSEPRRPFDWEGAGQRLGESFDGYHAVVVAGNDPVITGRVAIGIGRAQAKHRRTAVGDLFAESQPIQDLVRSDDPHGLVDAFLYGISLNRIAHAVPGAGELFVMPSGTEPPDYEAMLGHPRWLRLAVGFEEVGALLVLAVPARAPKLAELVDSADGVVFVGPVAVADIPASSILGTVEAPRLRGETSPPESAQPAAAQVRRAPERKTRWWRAGSFAGLGISVTIAAIAAWLAYRPLAGGPQRVGPTPGSPKAVRQPTVAMTPESKVRDTAVDTGTLQPEAPEVNNPEDSAQAAAFGVELLAANTQAGAILKLQKDGKTLPAATFAPALIQGAQWYKVIAGAYKDRVGADSLLETLRRRKVLDPGNGAVVNLPLAFLIDSGVPASAVPGMVSMYADRGQPVYALRQANGSAWLLIGAFQSPQQSLLYASSLRASGITPVLVYRKGRSF
ncbi:MAG TPA: SPOR domain-containing protein [Gemmatimonadaceae bacterium]